MERRVVVDTELCIGTGDCARLVPDAFLLDPRIGVSTVLDGAAAVDLSLLEIAARNCPTEAITVTDDEASDAPE